MDKATVKCSQSDCLLKDQIRVVSVTAGTTINDTQICERCGGELDVLGIGQ